MLIHKITFLLQVFLIGIFSDIGLNLLSHQPWSPPAIRALRPYFKHYGVTTSFLYAGLTSLGVATLGLISYLLLTRRSQQLFSPSIIIIHPIFLLGVMFIMGYLADVIIDKWNIFGPTLHPYYQKVGSGLWGGLAISFAAGISLFMEFLVHT